MIIADLHMLTTKNSREDVEASLSNARELVLDSLAAGIDPDHATFFLQSAVPELAEMNLLFQNLVTVPRLQRIPSLKQMAADSGRSEMPYGLLGYPVLQAADILCVRAELVPVGKDNEAHIEVTREIARRFNRKYGEVFPVPEVMIGEVPTLVGTDGKQKMSKSLGNAIFLSDDEQTVAKKVRRMYTDSNRVRADIPGTVEGNPVFAYHDAFNPDRDEVGELKRRYRRGDVGDVEVKEKLTRSLQEFLRPIRERREDLSTQPGLVDELIWEGTQKARSEARETLGLMKRAMGLSRVWNGIRRKAEKTRRDRKQGDRGAGVTEDAATETRSTR